MTKESKEPIEGRVLYTGSVLAGDWHSAPPYVMLEDGRWYERLEDEE